VPDLGKCVGVSTAHEAVADESDAELFLGHGRKKELGMLGWIVVEGAA
jgi:hypothetical protein